MSWIFNKFNEFTKDYTDITGKDKKTKPVFDLLGYQSLTLKEALKTGIFQNIEFVKHEKLECLDEDIMIKSKTYLGTWNIKKKTNEKQIKNILDKAIEFIKKKFTDKEINSEVIDKMIDEATKLSQTCKEENGEEK